MQVGRYSWLACSQMRVGSQSGHNYDRIGLLYCDGANKQRTPLQIASLRMHDPPQRNVIKGITRRTGYIFFRAVRSKCIRETQHSCSQHAAGELKHAQVRLVKGPGRQNNGRRGSTGTGCMTCAGIRTSEDKTTTHTDVHKFPEAAKPSLNARET